MAAADPADPSPDAALLAALARLIAPLARLAVARGVPYAALDGLLRGAMVASAHASHPGLPEHRRTSRVSAATGLNRREVTRLLATEHAARAGDAVAAPPRSPAAMVFAHWRATPAYRTRAGAPRVLPRSGPGPSFESLAQAVTRDVHPRALLEELLRLGLAVHDSARDTVALARQAFVPRDDQARMAHWLGANAGDHLAAAVANVLGREPAHVEQAIAAAGLSAASLAQLRPLLQRHWQGLTDELVPWLEAALERDAAGAAPAPHRVRIGLYGFDDSPAPAAAPPVAAKTSRRRTP